jgi:Protein of unknown function (DUF3047)
MCARKSLALIGLLAGCAAPDMAAPPAAREPAASFAGWSSFMLPGKRATRYTPQWLDGRAVVRADAEASCSMYRRPLRLLPQQLGTLRFSWKAPIMIPRADLSNHETADSPVRVVLAFEGDMARLSAADKTLFEFAQLLTGEMPPYASLMYVWDNKAPVGSVIAGGRSKRIRKIVVDSGPTQADVWRFHERSIVADYRRAYGEEPGSLIGVALMTDTDNTLARTHAWYGPVQVVAADGRVY